MIVHGEFRIKESATTQESEMVRLGAFQRDTRYYQRGLIVLLAKKWITTMGLNTMGIGVIMIVNGIIL